MTQIHKRWKNKNDKTKKIYMEMKSNEGKWGKMSQNENLSVMLAAKKTQQQKLAA